MYISKKIFQKTVEGETHKEAYLALCKWVGKNIVGNVEIGDVYYNIKKIYKENCPACKLEVFIMLEDETFLEEHCKKCQEFHKLFYINQQFNCDACNMTAYRKHLDLKLQIKKEYRVQQLKNSIIGEE